MNKHIPVLFEETIEGLNIKANGIYVDCTLGGGGHASAILSRLPQGHLYAFEQDAFAISHAKPHLEKINSNFTIINDNFSNIKQALFMHGINHVDGILFDLGVSSFQLDQAERGFSYHQDARLDMRMDTTRTLSAYDVVNQYSEDELAKIFFRYGEEKFGRQIARKIIKWRQNKPLETTLELVEVIKKALPASILRKNTHPAKRIFQAIRIEVNQELAVFESALLDSLTILKPGGRICVISFHSLEDRICKEIFRNNVKAQVPAGLPFVPVAFLPQFTLISKKAITPSEQELDINSRSHSAKLRIIQKNE